MGTNSDVEALDTLLYYLGEIQRRITETSNHKPLSSQRELTQPLETTSKLSEDVKFLSDLFVSRELVNTMRIHNDVVSRASLQPPLTSSSLLILEDVAEELYYLGSGSESDQLLGLLSQPHLVRALDAHDRVAAGDFLPRLPEVDGPDIDFGTPMKIIKLVKSGEPLGATIKLDESSGRILIARVMAGGVADRCGLIAVGDEVMEVNGVAVKGKGPDDVIKLLGNSRNAISFKLIPAEDDVSYKESSLVVRANFDYDPMADRLIPCKEAGLPFSRGDIIQVVSTEDKYWWQGRKRTESTHRAGLIPGRTLQEKRLAQSASEPVVSDSVKPGCTSVVRASLRSRYSPRKSPRFGRRVHSDSGEEPPAPVYEEVGEFRPQRGRFRPVVLVGAPGVGRNSLKQLLIASDPERIRAVLPHTSRARKPGEVDGKDYFFVSKEWMSAEEDNFLEIGEFKNNSYGTSVETVRSLYHAGYLAVLNPRPQSLKILRRLRDVKPFVVFVKPPTLPRLLECRRSSSRSSSQHDADSIASVMSEDELQDLSVLSEYIENTYHRYFDKTIVNDDLDTAFGELKLTLLKLELDPSWVPKEWLDHS